MKGFKQEWDQRGSRGVGLCKLRAVRAVGALVSLITPYPVVKRNSEGERTFSKTGKPLETGTGSSFWP